MSAIQDIAPRQWATFDADGYKTAVSGVVFEGTQPPCCGMPLGGLGTGCFDLDVRGVWGFVSAFNKLHTEIGYSFKPGNLFKTALTRCQPTLEPVCGLRSGNRTWVLATREILDSPHVFGCADPFFIGRDKESIMLRPMGDVGAATVRYWGHYPAADIEWVLESQEGVDAPFAVSMRAWSPFLPGNEDVSGTPCTYFEVTVKNTSADRQSFEWRFNLPGAVRSDLDLNHPVYSQNTAACAGHPALQVSDDAGRQFTLAVKGAANVSFGGRLGRDSSAWRAGTLPAFDSRDSGGSASVSGELTPGAEQRFTLVLAWHAPMIPGASGRTWRAAYADRYAGSSEVAVTALQQADAWRRRVVAWQEEIYTDATLPAWLQDSLLNTLALIPETSYWISEASFDSWAPQRGVLGMFESPRSCPQIECIPCSWYGSLPLAYFFPELAATTLHAYRHFMKEDGETPFMIGQWGPPDFASPTYFWQCSLNGVCFVHLVDRLWRRTGEDALLREFYPAVCKAVEYTARLNPGPGGIISMPLGNIGMEWFEFGEWLGMCTHLGGLRLAMLQSAERMAGVMKDSSFQERCRSLLSDGQQAMESKMWNGNSYLNYYEESTGRKSDAVMAYQLDGEWASRFHGLPGVFDPARVATVLETVERCNCNGIRCGAVNFARPDGALLDATDKIAEFGSTAMFLPEVMILGMTYLQVGRKEFGLEMIRKAMEEMALRQGHIWDLPNLILGDSGKRHFGTDYYQNLMLWSVPAVLAGGDLTAPCRPGGLVERIVAAAGGNNL